MPTSRICNLILLCTAILFACNQKKQDSYSEKPVIKDTVNILANESLDVSTYNYDFEENSKQIFTALPHKVSVITAKKGLKITVDPGILEKEDGTAVDGNIKITIIELTNIDELFKSNAATVSNGRLLASGGSYFVGMQCGEQKLHIKKGKTLEMQFPKIKEEEMELFYGQRDDEGNMNWTCANKKLTEETLIENNIEFSDNYRPAMTAPVFNFDSATFYSSLEDPVYFYARKMTLKELVDTINLHSPKIYIDTLYTSLRGRNIKISEMQKLYRLKTCKDLQDELAKKQAALKEEAKQEKPKTLSEQLQEYYTPSDVAYLGWINCDRFYNGKQKTEPYFDLPITFTKGSINYFVMFKTMNGLLNGKVNIDSPVVSFGNLPVGEKATVVAFTKNNGRIYHCKEEFIVQKDKRIKLDFKDISEEEMKKIFGKNVRI